MRDIAILLILLSLVWAAWLRPWVGVLGLAVLTNLAPHSYANGFMKEFPIYLTLFLATTVFFTWEHWRTKQWPQIPWDWRIFLIIALWGYFLLSTRYAAMPWVAWPKFFEVSKTFLGLALTLLLIDTRQKLFYLLITIAASITLVVVKGGYWALMTGFHDRVYGPPGGQLYGNNEFAIAVAMTIPLLLLWRGEVQEKHLRLVLMAGVALSYAAALSSWSRGGLLALTAVSLIVFWHSRRKRLTMTALAAGLAIAWVGLPEQWLGRMETIVAYKGEASAEARLAVWTDAIHYALQHPYLGAGFDGWLYVTVDTAWIAWHSAYIQIMADHGLFALVAWAILVFGTVIALGRLALYAPDWAARYSRMLQASLVAYAVGSFFLSTAYWELLYQLLAAAILVRRFAGRHTALP